MARGKDFGCEFVHAYRCEFVRDYASYSRRLQAIVRICISIQRRHAGLVLILPHAYLHTPFNHAHSHHVISLMHTNPHAYRSA